MSGRVQICPETFRYVPASTQQRRCAVIGKLKNNYMNIASFETPTQTACHPLVQFRLPRARFGTRVCAIGIMRDGLARGCAWPSRIACTAGSFLREQVAKVGIETLELRRRVPTECHAVAVEKEDAVEIPSHVSGESGSQNLPDRVISIDASLCHDVHVVIVAERQVLRHKGRDLGSWQLLLAELVRGIEDDREGRAVRPSPVAQLAVDWVRVASLARHVEDERWLAGETGKRYFATIEAGAAEREDTGGTLGASSTPGPDDRHRGRHSHAARGGGHTTRGDA